MVIDVINQLSYLRGTSLYDNSDTSALVTGERLAMSLWVDQQHIGIFHGQHT
jgi:hypothetical protein